MISVEHVRKVYRTRWGPHVVLDDVNFKIARGDHVGIIGRNGSGKSTLIRLIGGSEQPTRGRVRRGMRISWPLALSGAFQSHLTGEDNLRFVCRIYGVNFRDVLPFVEEFTELGIYMKEPLYHYSSGMQARLAFALSLAVEFDCFLIDEVIVVGDSRFHAKCRAELFEKRKDRAFLIVSHDQNVIQATCQRAYVMVAGRLHPFDGVGDAYAFYENTPVDLFNSLHQ